MTREPKPWTLSDFILGLGVLLGFLAIWLSGLALYRDTDAAAERLGILLIFALAMGMLTHLLWEYGPPANALAVVPPVGVVVVGYQTRIVARSSLMGMAVISALILGCVIVGYFFYDRQ